MQSPILVLYLQHLLRSSSRQIAVAAPKMVSRRTLLVMMATVVVLHRSRTPCAAASAAAAPPATTKQARTPALFVFGDSIVDPGNNNALTTTVRCNFPPYGQDFPGHNATGRFSNGRVPSDIVGTFVIFLFLDYN